MLWSRLWLIALSLSAALLLALALLQPGQVGDALDEETGARLERAQQAVALFLKVNARQWMDTAAHDATDAVLVEALSEATRGPADLGIIHKTVQERLRGFAEKAKADLALATDARGRVIARTGLDDAVYKDGVEGFPLIAEALRGLRADDTWSIDGKLYRVAASPVIAPGRYTGALVMGQEVASELAQSLKQLLGVEVAFVLRGRVIAVSSPITIAQQLPLIVSERAAELRKSGHTPPLAIGNGDGRYLTVLAPFAGEAAGHQACYALLVARPPSLTLGASLSQLFGGGNNARWLALAPVAVGLIGVIAVGLLVLGFESGRPLKRLARETQALARGETPRLQDALHPGQLGVIARAVNTTLDRLGTSSRPPTPMRPEPRRRAPEPESEPSFPAQPALLGEAPVHEPVSLVREYASSLSSSDDGVSLAPPLDDSAPNAPQLSEITSGPDYVSGPSLRLPSLYAPVPQREEESTAVAPSPVAIMNLVDSAPVAVAVAVDEAAEELRSVFQEFLETKQRLGEPTEGVTFEKFAIKLKANRMQLMTKFGCKAVRFQVYVKDGKAALKATPIQG